MLQEHFQTAKIDKITIDIPTNSHFPPLRNIAVIFYNDAQTLMNYGNYYR